MSILNHPRRPQDRNWVLLADFITGDTHLLRDHQTWLDSNAIPALSLLAPKWVYIRGFASRSGKEADNLRLSRGRAEAVRTYLLEDPTTNPSRITATDSIGDQWDTGGEDENRPRWRSVEVIMTASPRQDVSPSPAPPALMKNRIVEINWTGHVTNHRGAPSPDRNAEAILALVEAWTSNQNPRGRRSRERRNRLPISYRINRITVTRETISTTFASGEVYKIEYQWGVPHETISLRNGGQPERRITRGEAQRWIVNPGRNFF